MEYKTVTYPYLCDVPNEIRLQAAEGWSVDGYWSFAAPLASGLTSEHIVTYVKTFPTEAHVKGFAKFLIHNYYCPVLSEDAWKLWKLNGKGESLTFEQIYEVYRQENIK